MNKEKVYLKKYKKIQDRYGEARKKFLKQQDDFETQTNRNKLGSGPKSRSVRIFTIQEQLKQDARGKYIDNINNLNSQDDQLAGINRTAEDIYNTSNAIQSKLRNQRDKITDATDDIREANQNVNVGRKIINEMTRKECCYKLVLYILIVVLFLSICAVGILNLAK